MPRNRSVRTRQSWTEMLINEHLLQIYSALEKSAHSSLLQRAQLLPVLNTDNIHSVGICSSFAISTTDLRQSSLEKLFVADVEISL